MNSFERCLIVQKFSTKRVHGVPIMNSFKHRGIGFNGEHGHNWSGDTIIDRIGEVGEGVCNTVISTGDVDNVVVILGEKFLLTGLMVREVFLMVKVFKGAMISVNRNGSAEQVSAPLLKSMNDREELFFMHRVV